MDDSVLLGRFAETGCQASFNEIVDRHSGWIFSLALRAVRDRHLAEDVTQAVFIIFAKKAKAIREGTPLSGWLFKAARFAVSDALKRRTRMRNRENRFAEFFKATTGGDGAMEGTIPGDNPANIPDEISHTLDEAVACLSEADRQAVLLRFYEGKSLAEVGQAMNTSEEAAKKRVARAVEKMRKYFANRGVITTATVLLLLLGRRSAEAANFVPTVVAPCAAPSIAHAIADGGLQLMAHAQAKLLGAILAAGLAVLIAVPTLGGAVARHVAAGGDVVAQDVRPLYGPTDDVRVHTPARPKESKFTDVWIGHKGQILWRSDTYTDAATRLPFYLKAGQKQERPYAVAVDHKGQYYIRPLDKAIVESPIVRDGRWDYDNGPVEPADRVNQVLSLIDAHDDGGLRLARGGPSPRSVASTVLDPARGKPEPSDDVSADPDWHQVPRHHPDEDGPVVIDPPPWMKTNSADGYLQTGPADFDLRGDWVQVPEPATGLLVLGAASLLTLRRRRR